MRGGVGGSGERVKELLERGEAMISLSMFGLGGGTPCKGETVGCSGRSGSSSRWRYGEGLWESDGCAVAGSCCDSFTALILASDCSPVGLRP